MIDSTNRFEGYWKACVNEDYVTSVLKAGAVPYILPIVDNEEIMEKQVQNLDGIIFSGGPSVDSLEYGEEHLKKPTSCICRGHRSILYDILQKEEVWTNSSHNQAIKDIPEGFKVTGISTDGVIEAIEYEHQF